MDNNNNTKITHYLDGGDVCGFVVVVVGGSGRGRGCGRVHLVDHSTEILIPQPFHFQPPPPQTLVDCGVVEGGDLLVRSNLTAQKQNGLCYLPPLSQKNHPKSPQKV